MYYNTTGCDVIHVKDMIANSTCIEHIVIIKYIDFMHQPISLVSSFYCIFQWEYVANNASADNRTAQCSLRLAMFCYFEIISWRKLGRLMAPPPLLQG